MIQHNILFPSYMMAAIPTETEIRSGCIYRVD